MKLKPIHIILLGVTALAAGIGVPAIFSRKKGQAPGVVDPVTGKITPPSIPSTPLTSGQAITIANNLLSAMDRYGTDEKAIIDNLSKCQTRNDLLLVIEKFGTHKYLAVGTMFGLGKEKDLIGWLKADLSKSELQSVKVNIFDKLNVAL